MQKTGITTLFFSVALFISGQQAFCTLDSKSSNLYQGHLDVGGYYFTSQPHAGAFIGAFMPLVQNANNLLYADLRGLFKGSDGSTAEGNFGVAYRHLTVDQSKMYGVYTFYDRKRTTYGQYFNQITFGFESW